MASIISILANRNVIIWLFHAGVMSLVGIFVNGTASFLLNTHAHVNPDDLPKALSTLILVDEVAQLGAVIVWGALIDRIGLSIVGAIVFALTSIGIALMGLVATSLGTLLVCRVLYCMGSSGMIVTFITSVGSLSKAMDLPVAAVPDEIQPLVPKPAKSLRSSSGTLMGLCSLIAGTASIVGAFVLNRLPAMIGLSQSYAVVLLLPACMSIIMLLFFRPPRGEPPVEGHLASLARGFKLLFENSEIALACAASFTVRAQMMLVVTFVPQLVNEYYLKHDLCNLVGIELPNAGSDSGCRPAYALASTLLGGMQSSDFFVGPMTGLLLHKMGLPARWLVVSSLIGAMGNALLALLPGGDPRFLGMSLPAAVLNGASLSMGITLAMAICAEVSKQYGQLPDAKEVTGAVSSIFTMTGGLGIIFVVQGGQVFGERFGAVAPIALQSCVMLVMALWAAIWSYRHTRRAKGGVVPAED